jgi:hypothetical protein
MEWDALQFGTAVVWPVGMCLRFENPRPPSDAANASQKLDFGLLDVEVLLAKWQRSSAPVRSKGIQAHFQYRLVADRQSATLIPYLIVKYKLKMINLNLYHTMHHPKLRKRLI